MSSSGSPARRRSQSEGGNVCLNSDFLISAENDLTLFGVSRKFIDQPRMGLRVVESQLV
jgi:hypothetical protein